MISSTNATYTQWLRHSIDFTSLSHSWTFDIRAAALTGRNVWNCNETTVYLIHEKSLAQNWFADADLFFTLISKSLDSTPYVRVHSFSIYFFFLVLQVKYKGCSGRYVKWEVFSSGQQFCCDFRKMIWFPHLLIWYYQTSFGQMNQPRDSIGPAWGLFFSVRQLMRICKFLLRTNREVLRPNSYSFSFL